MGLAGRKDNLTIKDIARLTGVSVATVSRVMNNKPDVNEATRQRVLQCIEANRYSPRVSRLERDTVGLLLSADDSWFRREYRSEAVSGLMEVAAAAGFTVNLIPVDWSQDDAAKLKNWYLSRGLLGYIMMHPGIRSSLAEQLAAEGIPHVVLGGRSACSEANWVIADNAGATVQILEHLTALGHQRIAMVSYGHTWDHRERRETYKGFLQERKLPCHGHWQLDLSAYRHQELPQVLPQRLLPLFETEATPTALLITGYDLTLDVLAVLRRHAIAVPDTVSVASYGDYQLVRYYDPPLTTVRVPTFELGRRAAELLIKLARGTAEAPVQEFLDTQLIVRQSTAVVR